MGTVVMGKAESGSVSEGDSLMVMPNKAHVKVLAVYCDEDKVRRAGPGENLRVRLSGIEEEVILSGFVLYSVARPIPVVTSFVAQLQFLEVLDNLEKEASPGSSTVVNACPVLNSSDTNLVDDTAPATRESNEEVLMERSAKVALHVVTDAELLSSQTVVPPEAVSISIVESWNMIENDHEVIVTSGTQSTESPSTKVDSPEKNHNFCRSCLSVKIHCR